MSESRREAGLSSSGITRTTSPFADSCGQSLRTDDAQATRPLILRRRPISTRSRIRWDSFGRRAPNARAISASRGTARGHASARTRSTSKRTGLRANGTCSPEKRTSRPPPSRSTSAERPSAQTSQNDAVRALPRDVITTLGPSYRSRMRATSETRAGMAASPAAALALARADANKSGSPRLAASSTRTSSANVRSSGAAGSGLAPQQSSASAGRPRRSAARAATS